jgi:hemerythrin
MYTPKPLQWDDALSTGDETLDNQHKYLVETLNNLGEAINKGHSADALARILGRLRFYAGWHFGREEECFETYHCPAAEKTKKLIWSSSKNSINTMKISARRGTPKKWR